MSYVYADVRQQNMLPANEMMAPLALTRRIFSFSQKFPGDNSVIVIVHLQHVYRAVFIVYRSNE